MKSRREGTCLLEIEFTLKPGKRREFSRSFEELHGHEGDGHVKTTVYEDCEEPGHMIWIADWASREALEAYIHTDAFGVLLGGIRVLGTLAECRLVGEELLEKGLPTLPPARKPNARGLQRIDVSGAT